MVQVEGWGYALSNIPLLPSEARQVGDLTKGMMSILELFLGISPIVRQSDNNGPVAPPPPLSPVGPPAGASSTGKQSAVAPQAR
ncbi:MAG: hypothetical protein WC527_06105 [Candidatus Margulisiibacteriota bacterium]